MIIIRLVISCLLLVSLPLQGMATAGQWKPPCPMEQGMAQADMDRHSGTMPDMPKADCCLDDDAALLSGQSCKAGQQCHVGQLSMMGAMLLIASPPVHFSPPHPVDPVYSPLTLTTIWRPPLTLLH